MKRRVDRFMTRLGLNQGDLLSNLLKSFASSGFLIVFVGSTRQEHENTTFRVENIFSNYFKITFLAISKIGDTEILWSLTGRVFYDPRTKRERQIKSCLVIN